MALAAVAVPVAFGPTATEVFAPIKLTLTFGLLSVGLLCRAVIIGSGAVNLRDLRFHRVLDSAVIVFGAANLIGYLFSTDRSVSLVGQFPEYKVF